MQLITTPIMFIVYGGVGLGIFLGVCGLVGAVGVIAAKK